jgi:hypothetical protein
MKTYPNIGPALEVTQLPADCPAMAEWIGGHAPSLLSHLHMAVDTLSNDDAYPALRQTRCLEVAVLVCRDDEHLEEAEAELADIGAKWERIGMVRRVQAHDGDYYVKLNE